MMQAQVPKAGLQMPPLPGLEASQDAAQGAVLPSLRATLNWLKRCSQERPKAPLQVCAVFSVVVTLNIATFSR